MPMKDFNAVYYYGLLRRLSAPRNDVIVSCDFVAVAYASAMDSQAIPLHSACGYFTTIFTSLPGTTPEQVRGRLIFMPA